MRTPRRPARREDSTRPRSDADSTLVRTDRSHPEHARRAGKLRRRARGRPRRTAPPIDFGWLFLLPGLAILSAAVLIPAADELAAARWQRDRTRTMERAAAVRIEQHRQLVAAIQQRDPVVLRALEIERFGTHNEGDTLLASHAPASGLLSAALRVDPAPPPPLVRPDSLLQRLASDDRSRLWLVAGGAVACLVGFMTAGRGGEPADTIPGDAQHA